LGFLAILREGETCPASGTKEATEFMMDFNGVLLELTHNHGTENEENFKVNNGNEEPHRGFGHIAVMTRDVYAASEELEKNGVSFKKRPDEGMMKGLAFALDPDGYWIEIIRREEESPITNKFTFAQTMLRVKDPEKSIKFYRDLLGMNLCYSMTHEAGKFTNNFLTHAPTDSKMKMVFEPVIELTHNHGTETQEDF
jgi:lactoylglutathione lyase